MQKYKSRKDVPEKYKWDLTPFFQNEKEYNDAFNKVADGIKELKEYNGCTKDANKLLDFLEKDIRVSSILEDLYAYAYLTNDEVLGISKNMDRRAKIEDLMNNYFVSVSFFSPEILKLSKEEYKKLFTNENLKKFKVSLDRIYRNKDHILDEDKENIITELDNAMNHFSEMSSTMLNSEHDYGEVEIDGEVEVIAPTNYRRLMKNKNRELRKEVREKYNKTLARYGVSSAQFLNGYVKANITNSKLHNFDSAWDSKLFGLNMPNEVFETLRKTVEENIPIYKKYYKLYKDVLKLDDLYQYDLNMDLAQSDKEYSVEDAQKLILEAIKPLGEDYQKHFRKIFDNRYVDYAQYPGKRSGGYSLATINQDSRILMSYNFDLASVSTLAHEGGHNVHHQLVALNNEEQYRNVPNIVAEVASLTNECLLSSYLAEYGEDKEEKLSGIANILTVIDGNLFDCVREAKMEEDFYNYALEGNAITKDYMNELTLNSLKKYHGDIVKLDEYSGNSWIRRSHYFMNYYLYSYSICISVASFVASEILSGNKDMLDKYMKFLATGGDKWPTEAFAILGVDLTKKDVYQKAINYFDSLINKFRKVYEGDE